MSMSKVSSVLLRKQVYDYVLRLMLTGQLNPGEKILEERLSRELGVSRTPIREALRLLESDGYIQVTARRGAVVAAISAQEVKDVFDVVSALEGRAVLLACPLLDDAKLKRLRELNGILREIAAKGDIVKYLNVNHSFHALILNACPNALLLEQIGKFRNRVERFRMLSLSAPARLEHSVDEHEAIIEALAARQGARSKALQERHVLNAAEAITFVVQRMYPAAPSLNRA
jgi:DNA-binding GntR family transcriptional regulator